ncbi:MAG: alpha/beta fold hydrolase [Bacteroidota bacterium]
MTLNKTLSLARSPFLWPILLLTLFTNMTSAQTEGKLPPIIDREIFFGNPEISGAQLSPDGQFISFIKPYEEVRNIWVKGIKEPFEKARPLTADTKRPIPGYTWSRDGKFILFVQDKAGDENYQVYAVDPAAAPATGEKVPEARNLTDVEGVRAFIYGIPKSNPDLLYVGMNDRDPSWHDLYQVSISTGKRTLLKENTEQITGWDFDRDDQLRLASRSTEDGGTEILRIDPNGFTPIYKCNNEETCYTVRFAKDNKQVYMASNQGNVDLTQLMLMDPETGATTLVESDPENKVDFGGALFSDKTDEIVLTSYVGEKQRLYFKDKDLEKDYNYLQEKYPDAEINFGSKTKDERYWLINVNSDVDPGATYLFDRKNRKTTFQYRPRPNLPVEHLAHMEPVTYRSYDSLEIPAYLTLPKGVEAKNLPVVMIIHGGPWARDNWGYNSYAQFWANRGYAVLQPNFRGSTGYGKAFLNGGNGEWGDKMQDDITSGADWLIEQGIADPERIALFGGSYGGYATLAGLTFTPDKYAAGISIVGPSNIITLLESIPPYWESIRKLFYKRIADPTTPEGEAQLKRQSPLYSAQNVQAPLLVVQGANDPRVKQAESDQMVVIMRELGLPVEYIVAPDEGHGFARPVNNMAFLAASEKFFSKHLQGRYQESMTDEVAKRLEEITVDINSVEMPENQSTELLNQELPSPSKKPVTGSFVYGLDIEMGGQKMEMTINRQIKKDGNTWLIEAQAEGPMGMKEKYALSEEDLSPKYRLLEQGPLSMELDYETAGVSGMIKMNGSEKELNQELEAGIFMDGAGLDVTLASLPLEEGFTGVYRIFDLQSQKVVPYRFLVAGVENVSVPAGTYPAYRIEASSMDGNNTSVDFWISKEGPAYLLKTSYQVPQMSGATLTMVLEKIEP